MKTQFERSSICDKGTVLYLHLLEVTSIKVIDSRWQYLTCSVCQILLRVLALTQRYLTFSVYPPCPPIQ